MAMADNYSEDRVVREKDTKAMILKIVLFAIAALALFIVVLIPVFFPGGAIVWFGVYFFLGYTKLEYEYLFVGGELDVDKIIAQRKRKRVMSVDFSTVQLIAPVGSHRLDTYTSNGSYKVVDCSSGNTDARRYSVIVNNDGKTYNLIIEPSKKTLDLFKMTSHQKVFMD